MFTYVAAHIVAAQLMNLSPRISTPDGTSSLGSDGESEARRVGDSYDFLMEFLAQNPVRSGDDWLRALARAAPALAARVAEVRAQYAERDFEWDVTRRLVRDETSAANLTIMREWAAGAVVGRLSSDEDASAPGG